MSSGFAQFTQRAPWIAGLGVGCGLAAVSLAIVGQVEPDQYDQSFALLWGRDIANWTVPDFSVAGASTPHPLTILFGTAVAPLGVDSSLEAAKVFAWLSLAGVLAGVYLLGAAAFGSVAGLVAAALTALNPTLVSFGLVGTADAPFGALVLVAGSLEVRRPRCGLPVMALLALAGLLRPEAWLIAGAYWLFLARGLESRPRMQLLAVALSAPLAWMAMDLAVTGNPLFSLLETRDATTALARPTGASETLPQLASGLDSLLSRGEIVAGVAGLGLAAYVRWRGAIVPAALVVLSLAGYIAVGLAGLPLIIRYLLLPATVLMCFVALALIGWTRVERGALRAGWTAGAALLLVLVLGAASSRRDAFASYRATLQQREAAYEDLRALIRRRRAAAPGCERILVPSRGIAPLLALYANTQPRSIRKWTGPARGEAVMVVPAREPVARLIALSPERLSRARRRQLRPGVREVAANHSWRMVAGSCAGATSAGKP